LVQSTVKASSGEVGEMSPSGRGKRDVQEKDGLMICGGASEGRILSLLSKGVAGKNAPEGVVHAVVGREKTPEKKERLVVRLQGGKQRLIRILGQGKGAWEGGTGITIGKRGVLGYLPAFPSGS